MRRKFTEAAILDDLRYSEMNNLLARLERISEKPKSRMWARAAEMLFSAALGGAIGFLALLTGDPPRGIIPAYIALLVVLIIVSVICFVAERHLTAERAESVGAIREDLESLLKSFEFGPDDPATEEEGDWEFESPAAEAS